MSDIVIDVQGKRSEPFEEEECDLEYESDEEEAEQLGSYTELERTRDNEVDDKNSSSTNDIHITYDDGIDENAIQSNSYEDQFEDTNNEYTAENTNETFDSEEDEDYEEATQEHEYQAERFEERLSEENFEGDEIVNEQGPEYSETEEEQYLIEEFSKEENDNEVVHDKTSEIKETEGIKEELEECKNDDPLLQIPVYLDIGDDVIKLFPPTGEEDPMFLELPLLFNNTNIVDQPISEVFDTFRLYTSTLEEVIVFKIPTLSNLSIRSDSIESRTITLASILEIVDILKQKDEETYKYVQIEVSREMGLGVQLKKMKESALYSPMGKRSIAEDSGPENKKIKL